MHTYDFCQHHHDSVSVARHCRTWTSIGSQALSVLPGLPVENTTRVEIRLFALTTRVLNPVSFYLYCYLLERVVRNNHLGGLDFRDSVSVGFQTQNYSFHRWDLVFGDFLYQSCPSRHLRCRDLVSESLWKKRRLLK